ncbi:hypothetical protein JYK14_24425 [Siccirubricoccus sp. KC 17139]|uniref:Uncharacterized protein n=1 Tax=Siccirubricoccus soli TaxID=2899147 RepID=A0ABT1DBG6_9PROT|nr:hypothetical protein [Siccirubricoccus soli]MCO6419281.1 hypothetical protein [Siccirubricoccus soli]MCP2685416.1 hypothetical protein [Siccirubricoccus soli]
MLDVITRTNAAARAAIPAAMTASALAIASRRGGSEGRRALASFAAETGCAPDAEIRRAAELAFGRVPSFRADEAAVARLVAYGRELAAAASDVAASARPADLAEVACEDNLMALVLRRDHAAALDREEVHAALVRAGRGDADAVLRVFEKLLVRATLAFAELD